MPTIIRKIKQSPWEHGVNEQWTYRLNTAPWGGTPTNTSCVIEDNGEDVTSDVSTGSTSVVSDHVHTPVVDAVLEGRRYLIKIKFTSGGNVMEAWGKFDGTR